MSTVEIRLGEKAVNCEWRVKFPFTEDDVYRYSRDRGGVHMMFKRKAGVPTKLELYAVMEINSSILQVPRSNSTKAFSLEYVEEDVHDVRQSIRLSRLLRHNVIIKSPVSTSFYLRSEVPHVTRSLTFRVWLIKGELIRQLPRVKLSENSGCITSPSYDGMRWGYPYHYRGHYSLDLSQGESIFINFHRFHLERPFSDSGCGDTVTFMVGPSSNLSWSMCGYKWLPPKVYRDSVVIKFQSDNWKNSVGFKMLYAVVPRHQEPQPISESIYNCSVPYFEVFAPVLRCNYEVECAGGEDEIDCEFYSPDCGPGAMDVGNKCYTPLHGGQNMTWFDANVQCLLRGERLATFGTPKEYDIFVRYLQGRKSGSCVFVGLQQSAAHGQRGMVKLLYAHIWFWTDNRTAFHISMHRYPLGASICGKHASPTFEDTLTFVNCYIKDTGLGFRNTQCDYGFVCEKDKVKPLQGSLPSIFLQSIAPSQTRWNVTVVRCPGGHVVRDFLSCDPKSQCGVRDHQTSCQTSNMEVGMFVCEPSMVTVHYTLVCDHIQHCPDNSDEEHCYFPTCPPQSLKCRNGQCLFRSQVCDRKIDCADTSDEEKCNALITNRVPFVDYPFKVDLDGFGKYNLTAMNDSTECPSTHFLCHDGVCLPVYLRCNNIDDCSAREDEKGCETHTCPGYYRCLGSKVCLHPEHVCDGKLQCPENDDELHCQLRCPDVCQCQGLAFVCPQSFDTNAYPELRFLDASGSSIGLKSLETSTYLIYASLAGCRIKQLHQAYIPNLRHLDLSRNELSHINMKHFMFMKNLEFLILTRNPLSVIDRENDITSESSHPKVDPRVDWGHNTSMLQKIDLSNTLLKLYNGEYFTGYSNLKFINLSRSLVTKIAEGGFQTTPLLESLDTRWSPLTDFPSDMLRQLNALKTVYTDNFKLCCQIVLPIGFDINNCHAKDDLLASCEDLLKSNAYRVFQWIFSILAIVGNVSCIISRILIDQFASGSYAVFVTSLTIADLLMGIYLTVIGAADLVYKGQYLFHDLQWKNSAACSAAGFLSLLSSEVSAFNICLITLDRFLVLRFPFSRVHFSRRSAGIACSVIWTVGFLLAVIPLLPATYHWQFFSQTGICIPLPFTDSDSFPGHTYSFSVMIILNFVLFLVIASGQVIIFWSIRANSLVSANRNITARDTTIARRLTTVIMSDFLCWFPIGLVGVLASTGTFISDELNVAMAIFVLPVNSALNPFLYTLSMLKEKWQKAREESLLKKLKAQIIMSNKTDAENQAKSNPVRSSTRVDALASLQSWLKSRVLTAEDVASYLEVFDMTRTEH